MRIKSQNKAKTSSPSLASQTYLGGALNSSSSISGDSDVRSNSAPEKYSSLDNNSAKIAVVKWHTYESLSRHALTILSVWLVSLLTTAMAASIFMPIKSTSAITPSETIDNTPAVGVSLSDIDFGGISTDSSGTIRTVSNTAIVNSSIYGYELYISSANNDSNALIRSGTTGTSPSEIIPASSTTDITAPTVLSHDTWGFAVQRKNTTANSGSEDVLSTAGFDTTYTTGDNSNPNNKFIALPTLGNKVLIAERSTSATNVLTNIYYGINVTTNTPSGLYQGTVTYTAIGKAPTTYTVTVKIVPGISSVTLGGDVCNSSNATDSTDEGDPEGTKYCEMILTYGYTYDLTATAERNYGFDAWNTSNGIGTFGNANAATTTFTAGQGNTTILPSAVKTAVDITLNQNGATIDGSTTTIATIGQTTLGTITNPQRAYAVSGFDTSYNNAADATVTFQSAGDCIGATNCSSNYTFDGWYEEAAATNKVASSSTTPVLQANTSYTNASSEWTSTSDQTLYAGWTGQAVTLPTITKTGYSCGWSTSQSAATYTYNSGDSLIPLFDTVLYGVCVANNYNITFLDGAINTGYEGTTQTLAAGTDVPVVDSNVLHLSTNTNYVVSFDYYGSESSNMFNVDLYPDDLPERFPIATTSIRHDDLTLSSSSSNMNSCMLRFFDNIDRSASSGSITITNIMLSIPNIQSKAYDGTLGTLPTPNKYGYTFDGWWTAPSGGTKINASTVVRGDVTYYAHWHSNVTWMQDFTKEMCQTQASIGNVTVRDRRNDEDYTVRYINNNCWMTSNLRITGYISNAHSHFTVAQQMVNVSAGDLTAGDSFDEPRTHTGIDSKGNLTVWYNFAATTAGTITGNSNSTAVTNDICPKGWRLFTKDESDGLVSAVGSSISIFNPIAGGGYYGGSLGYTSVGNYWSSTAYTAAIRYDLYYDSNHIGTGNGGNRYNGYNVRCIRSS